MSAALRQQIEAKIKREYKTYRAAAQALGHSASSIHKAISGETRVIPAWLLDWFHG